MELYIIFAIILVSILTVILGISLVCMLCDRGCTITIQQRSSNYESSRIHQEQEEKRQKKLSSRLKRTFRSSSKAEQPKATIENVKTIEFTLKLGDDQKDLEQITTINESSTILLPKTHSARAEHEARKKIREEIIKKYKLYDY